MWVRRPPGWVKALTVKNRQTFTIIKKFFACSFRIFSWLFIFVPVSVRWQKGSQYLNSYISLTSNNCQTVAKVSKVYQPARKNTLGRELCRPTTTCIWVVKSVMKKSTDGEQTKTWMSRWSRVTLPNVYIFQRENTMIVCQMNRRVLICAILLAACLSWSAVHFICTKYKYEIAHLTTSA